MIHIKSLFIMTSIAVSLAACKSSPDGHNAKTGEAKEVTVSSAEVTMNIDTAKSSLAWIGTKVTAHHAGTIQIKSGKLLGNASELKGGSFIIDMPTLLANNMDEKSNKNLTGHLMSPDFFDVAKYPEAKFEITDIKPFSGSIVTDGEENELSKYKITDPNVTVSGNLTIKDITKNIEFPAKVTMSESSATADAKFMIDRKLWNLTYPGMPDDLIKDEIWFGVSLSANI